MPRTEGDDLQAAFELLDKERWPEATAKLEVLQTSADPEVRDKALNFLADAYAATGRNADSEAMLRRSIEQRGERNEGLGPQLAVLAPLVRRQGRIEEAEEIYARALDRLRDDEPEIRVMTLRNIAYLYWTTGRIDRAREIYDRMPDYDEQHLAELIETMKPYVEPPLPDDLDRN